MQKMSIACPILLLPIEIHLFDAIIFQDIFMEMYKTLWHTCSKEKLYASNLSSWRFSFKFIMLQKILASSQNSLILIDAMALFIEKFVISP